MRFSDCHPELKYYCRGFCKPCYQKQYKRVHKKRDRTKKYLSNKIWATNNRDRFAIYARKNRYGLTDEQYQLKLLSQNYLCMICKQRTATNIDHNHDTGKVRDILCRSCNLGLGMFKENKTSLQEAINYLERHNDN